MIDTNKFKIKLEEEKARIENALSEISNRDPKDTENWNIKPVDDGEITFHDEIADRFEEMNENKATEFSLEEELKEVDLALEEIASGTYGVCKVCGKNIEEDRLEANPSAHTCKEHIDA